MGQYIDTNQNKYYKSLKNLSVETTPGSVMGLFSSKQKDVESAMGVKLRFMDTYPQTEQLRSRIIRLALGIKGVQPYQPLECDGWLLFHFKRGLPQELQDQAVRAMKMMAALEASREGISSIVLIETF